MFFDRIVRRYSTKRNNSKRFQETYLAQEQKGARTLTFTYTHIHTNKTFQKNGHFGVDVEQLIDHIDQCKKEAERRPTKANEGE